MLTRYEHVSFRIVLPVLFVLIAAIEVVAGAALVASGVTVHWRLGGAGILVGGVLTALAAWELHRGAFEESDEP